MNEFKMGQLLFYPLHGVGLLEDKQDYYYKLKFKELQMHIFIPQASAESLGLRTLCSLEVLQKAHLHFFDKFSKLPHLTSERKKQFNNKLRSGEIFHATEVIRDLVCAPKYELKLTIQDKQVLQKACDMVISELMYVANIPRDHAYNNVQRSIELRLKGTKNDFSSLVREICREHLKSARNNE